MSYRHRMFEAHCTCGTKVLTRTGRKVVVCVECQEVKLRERKNKAARDRRAAQRQAREQAKCPAG